MSEVHLTFTGKGGSKIQCDVRSPALTSLVRTLMRAPGRRLFQYRDDGGRIRRIKAADVNAYLKEISGAPISTKDFRTLAATAAAAKRLAATTPADTATGKRKQIATAVKEVAEMLGNTPAGARKSYVHQKVIDAFVGGALAAARIRAPGLSQGEAAVAALFK